MACTVFVDMTHIICPSEQIQIKFDSESFSVKEKCSTCTLFSFFVLWVNLEKVMNFLALGHFC